METCHGDERYDKTIMTTWNMAYQNLINEKNSSLAITIINMMSYLDGSCIKKELFYEYYDEYLIQTSLQLLQKYSLITINTSDDDLQQIIQVHSLVQYVIRMKSDQDYLKQFLDMIFSKSGDGNQIETFKLWRTLLPPLSFMLGEKKTGAK